MVEDFTDINTVMPIQRFSAKLAKVRLEFDRQHKPFDEQCARLDFKDKLDEAERESQRRNGFIKMDEIKLDFGNLEKYGNASLFELIDEQPHNQDKVIEGSRTQVIIGHTISYRCKTRGHGIAISVPMGDYKNVIEGKPLEKVEKIGDKEIVDLIESGKGK